MTEGVVATNSASLDDQTSHPPHPSPSQTNPSTSTDGKHSLAFWIIIAVLCLTTFVTSLGTLVITTALPRVTDAIGGQVHYVWIANSFMLGATVVQPLCAQLSNIFGRRNPMLIALVLSSLGSGIAGGAYNMVMLIAGRTIKGLGSGSLFVLVDLVVCDLVPLRDRAKYSGIVLSTAALGTALGPIVGSALAQADWRWCFYFILPRATPCLGVMAFFLRLKHQREPTWKTALARVDFVSALIFIPLMTALLLGLIMGGQVYPWSSWRVILPIVLGGVEWIAFHIHQAPSLCKEPSIPPRLFQNRTSAIGFILCFNSNVLLNWATYFLPFYFQAVKTASPLLSGVYVLPFNLFLIPSAMVSVALLSKLGAYKPLH